MTKRQRAEAARAHDNELRRMAAIAWAEWHAQNATSQQIQAQTATIATKDRNAETDSDPPTPDGPQPGIAFQRCR